MWWANWGNWYKVGIYGKYGWVEKSGVQDFSEFLDSEALMENRRDCFVMTQFIEEDDDALSFINSRPVVEIITPGNNDEVYNRTNMELLAVRSNLWGEFGGHPCERQPY